MSFRRSFELLMGRREMADARVARGVRRYLPPLVPWFVLEDGPRGSLVLAIHAHVVEPLSRLMTAHECSRFVEDHFAAFITLYRCYVELAFADGETAIARDDGARGVLELNRQRSLDDDRDEQLARSYRVWTAAYALGLLVLAVETRTTASAQCAVEMARSGRVNADILVDAARSIRRLRRAS